MLNQFVLAWALLRNSSSLMYSGGLRLIHFALSHVYIAADARGKNRTKEAKDLKCGRQWLPLVEIRANFCRSTLSEQYLCTVGVNSTQSHLHKLHESLCRDSQEASYSLKAIPISLHRRSKVLSWEVTDPLKFANENPSFPLMKHFYGDA